MKKTSETRSVFAKFDYCREVYEELLVDIIIEVRKKAEDNKINIPDLIEILQEQKKKI